MTRSDRDEISAAHHRAWSKPIRVTRRNFFNQRQTHIKFPSIKEKSARRIVNFDLEHKNMPSLCERDCGNRYCLVESHKPPTVFLRKTKQINIGERPGRENPIGLETIRVAKRNGIGPKVVLWTRYRVRQPAGDLRHWEAAGIVRLGHDTNAAILGNGTCSPAQQAILGHPDVRRWMMHMRGIEQGDEHVNV
jgi:hypothetical protein